MQPGDEVKSAMEVHQRELERFGRDVEYYQAHQDELLAQYPEQWVAIFNEAVVGADPNVDRLLTSLDERGIPKAKALIKHVTASDEVFILPG